MDDAGRALGRWVRFAARRTKDSFDRALGPGPRASCGQDPPIVAYQDADGASAETTPEQKELESRLEIRVTAGQRILHVGVGNHSLARRLHGKVAHIDGITVVPAEVASTPELPNYAVVLCDKHGPGIDSLPGNYDWIVDNNPSSFACCREHCDRTFAAYARLLTPGGRVLAHRRGAAWATRDGWSMSWPDWARVGLSQGLRPGRLTRDAWTWERPP
jgi:hypothetical protein